VKITNLPRSVTIIGCGIGWSALSGVAVTKVLNSILTLGFRVNV
jgi:hypothetical protein